MSTPTQYGALLEQVRARRKLPTPVERRRIRENAGVSLRAIGHVLGVSHTAIASWESGSTPREHTVAYAQLLEELRKATG